MAKDGTNIETKKTQSKRSAKSQRVLRILLIILLWVVLLPAIGLAALFCVGVLSEIILNNNEGAGSVSSQFVLSGVLGIILLMLLIGVLKYLSRFKSFKAFSKHLIIGMRVGVALFIGFVILGVFVYQSEDFSNDQTGYNKSRCGTLDDQLYNLQLAVVPIATENGSGTAFAVRDTNTLLTAYHVVEGASEIYANYASGKVPISVIQTRPDLDLTLLHIEQPVGSFLNLTSNYALGNSLYVYGYPGNTFTAGQPSLSKGILSRVIDFHDIELNIGAGNVPEGLEINQTDAAINAGNSGGPIVNRCGVVGVVSMTSDASSLFEYIGTVSEQNIGFGISSKTAEKAFGLEINQSTY